MRTNNLKKPKHLTVTTATQLNSIIKSTRDIMRKDKGLTGELDRLPQLTWIIFLKFLDDVEKIHESEAILSGKSFSPYIERPYRWRDWASKSDGMTGDSLIDFIDNEKSVRPDGSEGLGLLNYLKSLQSSNQFDRKDIIAHIFQNVDNKMRNGYLLRDLLNKVNEINFASSEEIHIIGQIYETLLKELRNAAGDSGEFYTPRPVVKFIVSMVDPKLGETILDPAAGTGGFLVQSLIHLEQQKKSTKDYEILQNKTLFGIEAKPLPYLLCQMNLLLHGLEFPNIDPLNALRFRITEIGYKERFNVILTNPPFGGEEERGILSNFPEDKQTSDTALLFLQLIMRKLHRAKDDNPGGRCGLVVPNGALYGDGVSGRIKEQLLSEFNLHTIIRLPKGVFSPYTNIATNLLFFEHPGPTKEVWYYELSKRISGNYSKSRPIQYEEFDDCIKWWKQRTENENAWKVPIAKISSNNYNLDIRNPNVTDELIHRDPEKILLDLANKLEKTNTIVNELNLLLKDSNAKLS